MVLSKIEPKTLDYDNARHPAGSRRNIRRKKKKSLQTLSQLMSKAQAPKKRLKKKVHQFLKKN